MTRLAITGYASLDYPVRLAGMVEPDRTTRIAARSPAAWPRAGGCPAYAARAAARAGADAAPVTWIGGGPEGAIYLDRLGADVRRDGIAQLAVDRSPSALLVYQADGSCACLYDPAFAGQERLTDAQAACIASASHLAVSVGPPHLLGRILSLQAPGARLYWMAKDDPAAFPPAMAAELARTADVVFCNRAERALVGPTPALVVETRGPAGAVLWRGERAEPFAAAPAGTSTDGIDTTGAGDTLAGAFIAFEMLAGFAAPEDAARALRAGLAAAASLLQGRTGETA